MGLTQAQLSRIENGPPVRHLDRLVAWATLLGMPQQQLWFALRPAVRSGVARRPGGLNPAHDAGADMHLIRSLRRADRTVGGAYLYATVAAHLARHPYAPPAAHAPSAAPNVAAAASFSEMAGWMALDAGSRTAAHRHLRQAVTLARNSGDQQLAGQVYASLAHFARTAGRTDAALSYTRKGLECLSLAPPCGTLEARLLAVEAAARAAAGQPVEAVQTVAVAETAMAKSCDVPSRWLSPFDDASFAIEAARCFRRVDDLAEAECRLRTAITLRDPGRVRSRALARLALVTVLLARGHFAEACVLVEEVLDHGSGVGSAVVWNQLRHVALLLSRGDTRPAEASRLVSRIDCGVREHAWITSTAAWYDVADGVADGR